MNITRFAIDRNRVSLTLLAILIIGGILAYINAPRSEDPGFTIRTALVVTYFPGAGPERVEQLVTDKLEQSIQEIEELDYLKSESRTGQSVIYVNLEDQYFDIQPVWDEVRRKVERTARGLPEGIHGPYVNDEFGEVFGITLALRGEGYSMAELKDHAEDIQDQLLQVKDVAQVEIHGTREERIYLEFDNAKLSRYSISALQLRNILQSQNILYPGGAVNINGEELAVEPSGNFESLKELRQTVIPLPESEQVVYLQDLVDVHRGYLEPAETKVTYNGEPALMLAISMRDGGNIIDMGSKVEQKVKQLQAQYPIGLEMDYLNRQPQVVDNLISDFVFNLLQSIAIVMLVMLASLGLRTGFLVSSVIPVTILTAFMLMRFLGIGIDIVSVGALLVALGILVDNSM